MNRWAAFTSDERSLIDQALDAGIAELKDDIERWDTYRPARVAWYREQLAGLEAISADLEQAETQLAQEPS